MFRLRHQVCVDLVHVRAAECDVAVIARLGDRGELGVDDDPTPTPGGSGMLQNNIEPHAWQDRSHTVRQLRHVPVLSRPMVDSPSLPGKMVAVQAESRMFEELAQIGVVH